MNDSHPSIEGIKMRHAVMPNGLYHAVAGSGHNFMTGVSCDVPVDPDNSQYDTVFICDVLPDYMVGDERCWDARVDRLRFLENAYTDIAYLLHLLEERGITDGRSGD